MRTRVVVPIIAAALAMGAVVVPAPARPGGADETPDPAPLQLELSQQFADPNPLADTASFTLADIDGDADLDLVRAGVTSSPTVPRLDVRYSNGDGTFGAPVTRTISTPATLGALAVGDVNNDTRPDIVVAGGQQRLVVALTDIDGQPGAPSVTGGSTETPSAIVLGHFNADANLDVVATNGVTKLLFYAGAGDGTFAAPTIVTIPNQSQSIAAADLDGDADLDVVVGARTGRAVVVARNDGAGAFTTDAPITFGFDVRRVVVGDFDNDTDVDVAAITENGCPGGGACLNLIRNNGAGTFTLAASPADRTTLPGAEFRIHISSAEVVGDFDGDTNLDLVLAVDSLSATTLVVWGDGTGGFTPQPISAATRDTQLFEPRITGARFEDIDGDGTRDLFQTETDGSRSRQSLIRGNPEQARSFLAPRLYPTGRMEQYGHVLTRVDDDEHLDIVFHGGAFLYTMLNDGAGNFAPAVQIGSFRLPSNFTMCFPQESMISQDLDGDGRTDLVCSGSNRGGAVAFGNGTETWPVDQLEEAPDGTYSGAAVADLDGTGAPEILLWSWRGPINQRLARIDVFAYDDVTGKKYDKIGSVDLGDVEPGPQRGLAVADFNGDSHLDVATRAGADSNGVPLGPERMVVLPGNGDRTFGPAITSAPGFPYVTGRLEAADINLDGIPDIVGMGTSGAMTGKVFVGHGNGDGTFATAIQYDAATGFATDMGVRDWNGDGLVDVIVKSDGAMTLVPGRGDGTLGAQQDLLRVSELDDGFAFDDVDGDNRHDIVVGLNRTHVLVVRTSGTTAGGIPDLTPVAFSGPAEAEAATGVTFQWTLRNDGDGAAHGPWRDRIMLTGPTGDRVVGEYRHDSSVVIEPGATLAVEATLRMPPAAIRDDYQWRLDVNGRGELPESDRSNNRRVADGFVHVDLPYLARNVDTPVTLAPETRDAALWTLAPEAFPVSIETVGAQPVPVELYVGYGRVPSRTEYDARSAPGASSLLLAGDGGARTVYVLAVTRAAIGAPTEVVLRARPVETGELATVTPSTVGAGTVTLEIVANAIGAEPLVELVDGVTRLEADATVVDGDRIWATFDLSGSGAQAYDVEVTSAVLGNWPEDPDYDPDVDGPPPIEDAPFRLAVASLADAVTVDPELRAGTLDIRLSAPDTVRAGREFDMTIIYANIGSTDIPAPLLVLAAGAEPGAFMSVEGDPRRSNQFLQILGAPAAGPADRLRPGASESVRVSAVAPRGAQWAEFPISLGRASETGADGPDWARVVELAGIPPTDGGFAAVVARAENELGPNWDAYAETLRAQAVAASQPGAIERSVPRLLERAVAGMLPAPPPEPAPEPVVAFGGLARSATKSGGTGDGGFVVTAVDGPFPSEPPDADAQSFYGEGDPRNWSRARALTFWHSMNTIADAGSLNPIDRGSSWSTSVFADHLDHYLNGDGSARNYDVDDNYSKLLHNDPQVLDYLYNGPRAQGKITEAVTSAASGLECESSTTVDVFFSLTEAEGGIGVNFDTFNAAYGLGKIPEMNIRLRLFVQKDADGALLYNGTMRVNMVDKYTWVYEDSGDEYQNWSTGGFAIAEDNNFKNWYMEHYGITKAFDLFVDLGNYDLEGTIPPGDCDEEPEPEEPPETPDTVPPQRGPKVIKNVGATDPNDKQSSGSGPAGAVRPGDPIDYTIRFENIPTATAPAQEVFIDDVLDANLDLSTLELTGFGFGAVDVDIPPGHQSYETVVTAPTDPNPVRFIATLDTDTRMLSWSLRSEDPDTLTLPSDPLAGFLPPNNDTGDGQGWVSFRVFPNAGLPDATAWTNNASIVFDVNDPIVTNDSPVTIDDADPTARVLPLPAEVTSPFAVEWEGTDTVGPVTPFDVYVSTDGGPFELWLDNTLTTTAEFTGTIGTAYGFAVVGTDAVDRTSAMPDEPDTTTEVIDGTPPTSTSTTSTSTTSTSTTSTSTPTTSTPTTSTPTTSTTVAPPSTTSPTTSAPTPTTDPPVETGGDAAGEVVLGRDGGVFALGGASFHGSLLGYNAVGNPVAIARTPTGDGYVVTTDRGAVYAFGDARFFGSLAGIALAGEIVDIVLSPSGDGYWLIGEDGGVFAFGDATFRGSLVGIELAGAVVGASSSPTGRGYTLFAEDGGVFAFGDATFSGSLGALELAGDIVGGSASASGNGYTLFGEDGGVFAFGDAPFFGSLAGSSPPVRVVDARRAGSGLVLLDATGRLHGLGSAAVPDASMLGGLTSAGGPAALG